MEELDSIVRDDLVRAAKEIAPLAPEPSQQSSSTVALLNGNRYDPQALVLQAARNIGASGEPGALGDTSDLREFFRQRAIPLVSISRINTAISVLRALNNSPTVQADIKEFVDAKDHILGKYHPLFSKEGILKLTENDIAGFIEEMFGAIPIAPVTANRDALRKAVSILTDETRSIDDRLAEIKPGSKESLAKGFGPAIITAILHVSQPDEYGFWNSYSEEGWVATRLWPKYKVSDQFGAYYQTVNEILKAIAREIGVDLWKLDSLWWKMDLPVSRSEQIAAIVAIARRIVEVGLDDTSLSRGVDAQENQKKYHANIKPILDEFIARFGTSPQIFLRNILQEVIRTNSLAEGYDSWGFHFVGNKMHSFTWAEITRKSRERIQMKASYHPQLFITVNRDGVRFGLAYGDEVEDTDRRVTLVQEEPALQELAIGNLKANPRLRAYRQGTAATMVQRSDDITEDLLNRDFREWTANALIVESYSLQEVPDDIVDRIESTLSALVPLFVQVSESTVPVPPEDEIWANFKDGLRRTFDTSVPFDGLLFTSEEKSRLVREIVGALSIGKHIILTGPPGTGKSKVAQAVCDAIAGSDNYHMCTASPDWSVYETIGGYRPRKDGTLEFHPGAFLRSFRDGTDPVNRWLIIDEINRADIDKAFGPLFSALAGDNVTLPFEVEGEPVRLIGRPKDTTPLKACNYIIHPDWRIIATMNTFDKSSLYEMSYAFMRRFAFVTVDSPNEVDAALVAQYADAWRLEKKEKRCQQVAELWNLVNRHRKIGPALFHDIYQFVVEVDDKNHKDDEMDSAIALFLFPQFEGLLEEQQKKFVDELVSLLFIADPPGLKRRAATFFHIPIWGST